MDFNRLDFIYHKTGTNMKDTGERFLVDSVWIDGYKYEILDEKDLKSLIKLNLQTGTSTIIYDLKNEGIRLKIWDIIEISLNIPD